MWLAKGLKKFPFDFHTPWVCFILFDLSHALSLLSTHLAWLPQP
jgi:hypothetical protein